MQHRPSSLIHVCAVAALLGTVAVARAQALPPPQNLLSLSASASVEVDRDWLTVVFSTTREAAEAAVVQGQLKQALESALAEARKAARAGQVEVQTGAFSLAPRYSSKGVITGWQGSAELVVQGRDVAVISQLTGRVQGLSIARVVFSLSREARAKVEAEVAMEAINRFRLRADLMSKQFGFSGYSVREVSVASDPGMPGPAPASVLRARAMTSSAEEALPVEAGKAMVTATVSGSVQMK